MSEIVHGDCLDVLSGRRAEFEAVVSDPPSGIAFMGLKFDIDHGGQDKWVDYMAARYSAEREACIQGAYGLYWALPRTQDWTMAALRRAGWHIVDVIQHIHGQGWPKGKGQLKPAQEAWILCRDPRGKVRPLNIDGSCGSRTRLLRSGGAESLPRSTPRRPKKTAHRATSTRRSSPSARAPRTASCGGAFAS